MVKSVKYRQLSMYILQCYNLKLMECYCTKLIFSITYISLLAVIFLYIAVLFWPIPQRRLVSIYIKQSNIYISAPWSGLQVPIRKVNEDEDNYIIWSGIMSIITCESKTTLQMSSWFWDVSLYILLLTFQGDIVVLLDIFWPLMVLPLWNIQTVGANYPLIWYHIPEDWRHVTLLQKPKKLTNMNWTKP